MKMENTNDTALKLAIDSLVVIRAQRDALAEALAFAVEQCQYDDGWMDQARAALAKAGR